MSRDRATGRIVDVWTEESGTTLSADAAVGALVLNVDDAAVFEGDGEGGTLRVGDQVVAYTDVDDDAGTVTLAEALTALIEADEDVIVWNTLYNEPDTVQYAHVVVDGYDHNHDPIEALVSDTIADLANGGRGGLGESCVIVRDGDVWELTRLSGRPSKARGLKFEADDAYTLTAVDIAAGTVTFPLSHRPLDESLTAVWGGVSVQPDEYAIDYAAQTITFGDLANCIAGDVLWVHYPYVLGSGIGELGGGLGPVAEVVPVGVSSGVDAGSGIVAPTSALPGDLLLVFVMRPDGAGAGGGGGYTSAGTSGYQEDELNRYQLEVWHRSTPWDPELEPVPVPTFANHIKDQPYVMVVVRDFALAAAAFNGVGDPATSCAALAPTPDAPGLRAWGTISQEAAGVMEFPLSATPVGTVNGYVQINLIVATDPDAADLDATCGPAGAAWVTATASLEAL